jgi:hypothetical protein
MPVYDRDTLPDSVGRGTLDAELAAWLPTGPTLGADVAIARGRRDHTVLGEGPWPPIGSVEHLVLPGPHGSLTVRRHTPTLPASDPIGALVYIHGGGFTYGTLDEFETAMRVIAERAGIATYVVDCQLAPSPTGSTRCATWAMRTRASSRRAGNDLTYVHNPDLTRDLGAGRPYPCPDRVTVPAGDADKGKSGRHVGRYLMSVWSVLNMRHHAVTWGHSAGIAG